MPNLSLYLALIKRFSYKYVMYIDHTLHHNPLSLFSHPLCYPRMYCFSFHVIYTSALFIYLFKITNERRCDICFSESDLIHSTWYSLVAFISCKQHNFAPICGKIWFNLYVGVVLVTVMLICLCQKGASVQTSRLNEPWWINYNMQIETIHRTTVKFDLFDSPHKRSR